jgi:hypothetical protein
VNSARYRIGVDLGTTNCALAYVDTLDPQQQSQILPIAQPFSLTTSGTADVLPSATMVDSIGRRVTGRAALDAYIDGRREVIVSAKSWLTIDEVDRRAAFLPWGAVAVAKEHRLSPIEASAEYLAMLRESWNSQRAELDPAYRLEQQSVVITVPASFDPIAQALTLEAAKIAGFPDSTILLEEPIAAFYHFLGQDEQVLAQLTRRPASILVIDSGGGTTDFSLLALSASGQLNRIRVGAHLLIGGDSLDLAVAHFIRKIDPAIPASQLPLLVAQGRSLKEAVLGGETEGVLTVTLPATGSQLFGNTRQVSIEAAGLREHLLEGFFPLCAADCAPVGNEVALSEIGLPYPQDPAITHHLAAFLEATSVDAVLFTGGTLIPQLIQDRLVHLITRWQKGVAPVVLPNRSYLLAVAHGAARFGLARDASVRRIIATYPHSLYLAVSSTQLLCVFSQGHGTGDSATIATVPLVARLGEKVKFNLYYSSRRPDDAEGDLVGFSEKDFSPLPSAYATLTSASGLSGEIAVGLKTQLTELGSLQLTCYAQEGSEQWNIDFHLHADSSPPESLRKDNPRLAVARGAIAEIYRKGSGDGGSPKGLLSRLESILDCSRELWDVATLRALWAPLGDALTRRGKTVAHEATWLQLASHSLRPGFGHDLDPIRINELWRIRSIRTQFSRENSIRLQTTLLWRRVAAGLTEDRQLELFDEYYEKLAPADLEAWRLLASLERVTQDRKLKLLKRAMVFFADPRADVQIVGLWVVSRVAGRELFHASPRFAVGALHMPELVCSIMAASNLPELHRSKTLLALCRVTNDPSRDVPADILEVVRGNVRREDVALLTRAIEVDEIRSMSADSIPNGVILAREQ